ncbi:DUF3068 domain-containing protein [Streptomyces sp. NPDC050315]|uniref:DUF3068 domain-containing protein n=1 Tax=Streptomyces sp. NPDC050315 TaxID=3155039 RepID=UPI003434FA87
MRKTASPLSLALLGSGVFLLVLAAMLTWYVEPRAKRTPVDVDVTTVLTGTGRYFETEDLETRKGRLTITRHVLGDVVDSERTGRAVWDVSTTIDTPRTLRLKDPRKALLWTTGRWVTDRRTNAPVHCCAESPTRYEGEAYLKFPFDVQRRTYRWWDDTLREAVPLRYTGTRRVAGYRGYVFTGSVPAARTGTRQVPGRFVDRPRQPQIQAEEWYANAGIQLVVDPLSGRIIDAVTSPRRTLRPPGGQRDVVTLLDGHRLRYTPATRRAQAALAEADATKRELAGETVPLWAARAGGVLALAGAVLVAIGRRPRPEAAPRAGEPEGTEPEFVAPASGPDEGRGAH